MILPGLDFPACMGIVNVTPDSFSDGGRFDSSAGFEKKIMELLEWKVPIWDIGAESTAPFNDLISEKQELERFEKTFFAWARKNHIPEHIILSIDTYRGTTFRKIYDCMRQQGIKNTMIWNDVSGVIDDELFETLSLCPDAYYVFCHTGTDQRKDSGNHMKKVFGFNERCAVSEICEYFMNALDLLESRGMGNRVILDPCFGFSKTIEHNHFLIKNIGKIMDRFKKGTIWLFGISRKSFLKKLVERESLDSNVRIQSEYFHTNILTRWFKTLSDHHYIVRLHDPGLWQVSKKYIEILDLDHLS
ncbi:MAG: dihydropteroate synthase [Bacteriovoracaceae bacterium]|nr:dihydropteroate synthase [Bacteriovoracaceae bacterium]